MRKPTNAKGPPGDVPRNPPASGEFADLPLLWEHLVHRTYEDGTARVTSSLTLFFEEGTWKACLSDRDNGLVAFVAGNEVLSLAFSLEAGLSAATLDWRPARKPSKR